jgi:formate/nitrite transporter FocA (FNT family)
MPAAVFEGKAKWLDAARVMTVSWIGNFMACIIFAYLTEYTELCPTDYASGTGCGYMAIKTVEGKVSKTFGQTFVKGIMCNWMVCMAVFLSSQAQDMTGKMVGSKACRIPTHVALAGASRATGAAQRFCGSCRALRLRSVASCSRQFGFPSLRS